MGAITKRVLFTGAGGFIGRQAVPYLLERGYEVHAVSTRPIALEGCHVHTANLLNEPDVKHLIESVRPDPSAASGMVRRAREILDVTR